MKRGDIKKFKEFLNNEHAEHVWKNGRRGQLKRQYGDYLYSQDREKFMVDLEEWLKQ